MTRIISSYVFLLVFVLILTLGIKSCLEETVRIDAIGKCVEKTGQPLNCREAVEK